MSLSLPSTDKKTILFSVVPIFPLLKLFLNMEPDLVDITKPSYSENILKKMASVSEGNKKSLNLNSSVKPSIKQLVR